MYVARTTNLHNVWVHDQPPDQIKEVDIRGVHYYYLGYIHADEFLDALKFGRLEDMMPKIDQPLYLIKRIIDTNYEWEV